jgi:hypothetical protein
VAWLERTASNAAAVEVMPRCSSAARSLSSARSTRIRAALAVTFRSEPRDYAVEFDVAAALA